MRSCLKPSPWKHSISVTTNKEVNEANWLKVSIKINKQKVTTKSNRRGRNQVEATDIFYFDDLTNHICPTSFYTIGLVITLILSYNAFMKMFRE